MYTYMYQNELSNLDKTNYMYINIEQPPNKKHRTSRIFQTLNCKHEKAHSVYRFFESIAPKETILLAIYRI